MDASDPTSAAAPRFPNFRWRIVPAFLMLVYGADGLIMFLGAPVFWFISGGDRQNRAVILLGLPCGAAIAIASVVSAKAWIRGRWKRAAWSTFFALAFVSIAAITINVTGMFR